jgi:hypothetical protein
MICACIPAWGAVYAKIAVSSGFCTSEAQTILALTAACTSATHAVKSGASVIAALHAPPSGIQQKLNMGEFDIANDAAFVCSILVLANVVGSKRLRVQGGSDGFRFRLAHDLQSMRN